MKGPIIGFFDSGVGGLSVLRHALDILPGSTFVYAADTAFAPYGRQPQTTVVSRCQHICEFLLEQGCEAIVVACNTATALAVDQLRDRFSMPIIAMEPALKPAVQMTRSGQIGVLATAGTLGSERYAQLKDHHGHSIRVHERICHQWVEAVEEQDVGSSRVLDLVNAEIAPLIKLDVDVLVLGCTHFPFLTEAIKTAAGDAVSLVDPAAAVVDQLSRRLHTDAPMTDSTRSDTSLPDVSIFTSGNPDVVGKQILALTGHHYPVQPLP